MVEEFFSVVRMMGYNAWVSLEMEDFTMSTEAGHGGYITIEQERDPRNAGGSLADLTASRDFLPRTGFRDRHQQ